MIKYRHRFLLVLLLLLFHITALAAQKILLEGKVIAGGLEGAQHMPVSLKLRVRMLEGMRYVVICSSV